MTRIALSSLLTSIPLAAMAEGGIDPTDINFLKLVAALAGAVAAILMGARAFVKSEIKTHEDAEEERAEARHQSLLTEIRHLHDRLVDNGALPALSGSQAWKLERRK